MPNKKKRILIFSDSLALPRKEPETTYFENTYPALLSEKYEVFQYSKGGCTIQDLLEQAHYYIQYKPDIVILQCGIVDCAPRAYTLKEETFFNLCLINRVIRKIISKTITNKRMRDIRQKKWTNESNFAYSCKKIKQKFPELPFLAIGILPASPLYEEKVKGISSNINKFNVLLANIFENSFIDMSGIPAEGIMSDFHHLNCKGHEYVFLEVDKILVNY